MNIGVYITAGLGIVLGSLYSFFYGGKHDYFSRGAALYSIGSVLNAYSMRLNVDPQMDFNFNIMVVADAAYFTTNTFAQAILIRLTPVDPLLSFGLAKCLASLVQIAIQFVFLSKNRAYTSSIKLERFQDGGKSVYLLPNTLKFGFSLAYNALLNDFFDQTYFVLFASHEDFLGQLTLIRGFGSLFIRFVYMPINSVTYNLYSKLYLESMKQDEPEKSKVLIGKIVLIVKTVIMIYSNLTYFLLCYTLFTSKVLLSLFFGDKWVTPTFIAGFLIYIGVILGIGVSGNMEGFAKSVFDQAALLKFNKLNTFWLVFYFVLLRLLQTQGLTGVMLAYFVFYGTRTVIAVWMSDSINPHIRWKDIVASFCPKPLECLGYLVAVASTYLIMTAFSNKPTLGFCICTGLGIIHFGLFIYSKKSTLSDFKRLIKQD